MVVIYVYFFILDTAPEAFYKDIIQGSATAIHTDGDSVLLQLTGEFIIGELHPWSVLNISGFDRCNALSSELIQNSFSRVMDTSLERTYRLYQSMMATR